METETLRPEHQNLAPQGETSRQEPREHPVTQLKQEATVNHQHHAPKSPPPNPSPNNKSNTTPQVPSPASDDPTMEMGDDSESLQQAKPSSASTDPSPHHPKLKKPASSAKHIVCAPVGTATPFDCPQVDADKKKKKRVARCNELPPQYPFSFPQEDGLSSDEDDDFCRYYRTMLRRKTDDEMAAAPTARETGKVVEQAKKARNTRQSNSRVQKRRAKEAVREIPFSDAKYHKIVGSMVLRKREIAEDLATIYGREYKESTGESSKGGGRSNERKRQRGCDTGSGGSGTPHGKRLRQTCSNSGDGSDKNGAAEGGRSTRYAKRNIGQVGSGGNERGCQGGSNKRQKSGGSNGGVGGDMDQKKMFEKHPDRKGWVVCKKCDAAVWPPNCGKHLFHCRKV